MSLSRQNYHTECEAAVNKQINLFMYAGLVYKSLAWYFDRDDVALPGFHEFFKKASEREEGLAHKLMIYQTTRGGSLVFQSIQKPERDSWGSGLEAMQAYLDIQKTLNQSLLNMSELAGRHGDPQMSEYLESDFLEDKVEQIKKASDYITNLKQVGSSGLGVYLFDREALQADR